MTIYQLDVPCWELTDLGGADWTHYDNEAPAAAELASLKRDDPDAAAKITRLGYRCWLVSCDGECELTLDTEGEGHAFHHASRAEAEQAVRSYGWVLVPGPASRSDLVFCKEDAPADGQVPPPSPAELEAAGQLRLPEVA